MDEVREGSFTTIDNDSRWIDYAQLGAVAGVDGGTRGTLYFDAFESRRDSYIGLTALNSGMELAAQTGGSQPAELFGFVSNLWGSLLSEASSFAYAFLGGNLLQASNSQAAASMPQNISQPDVKLQSLQQQADVITRMQSAITYTYDPLYRLTEADYSDGAYFRYTYRCNGLSRDAWGIIGCESDRVSQTVNGITTHYVLDQAAGLTQVLSDGTNTYLYGVRRIAQYSEPGPEYFLNDALGSVRQLVDANGEVTLAKDYEPYGEALASAGSGATSYSYSGEMTDVTGLIYLRARYLDTSQGRFLSKDTWLGDYNRPLSLNGWNYVEANPINATDPSGMAPECD